MLVANGSEYNVTDSGARRRAVLFRWSCRVYEAANTTVLCTERTLVPAAFFAILYEYGIVMGRAPTG